MKGIYLFDNKQNLIKSISADLLTENFQEQELGGQITGSASFPYKDFDEEAEYFGVKEDNNFWLYKIRKKTKESGYITIDGIHIFFDELKGAVVRDIRNQNTSGNLVVEKIISGTGWELKSNITERIASKNYYYESALSAFYDVVKTWNFEFVPEILFKDGKIISKKISIYDEISKDFGKWYEYGDKLISVVAESSTDELYTAFLGRGKGIATEDENGEKTGGYSRKIKFDEIEYTNEKDGVKVVKPKGTDYIEIKEATKLYGYPDGTPRIGVVDFDDIEDPKLLADATFEYALKNTRPKLQLRANALETENIELGETVAIIRPDMNIRYKVRVFKIQKDFLKDKVVSFEFGDKIVRSAGERLKSELYEKRRREEEIDSYIDSLRDEINSSYFNDAAYNYDLKIGNKYNLPAGYYSFDRPIDQDPTKVIYMGAGKMLVADKKNPDGSWKWGTMATGEGVVAESIVGTLGEFAKVNAYQINVNDEFADTALGKKVVVQGQLYNNVKITGTKGVQVLDNQNRERVQLGNWATNRYGLKLTDASGNRTILDDNGILQSWQDGRCDNVDDKNPLKLHIYIPKETQRIYKAALRIYTEGFRAYSKATEWKGTQSTSTKSGGGDYTSTGSGGGGYPSTEYAGDSAPTSHSPSDVEGGMYDYNVIGGGGGHVSIYKTTLHKHVVEIPSHSHRVDLPEHTHRVSIESHTHDVEIPGHQHDIVFGIYQEYASNVRTEIYINGTDRTAAISGSGYVYGNNEEMNLTAYLKNGWNEIEIKSNGRCRVDATIFIQALLNYGGY
ncbi:phage tail spike protein [Peptoniphilus genitalis]|uniref:phage tail spike protein n=1 Tax=Peptoniphilus genitalis TaxID=3036303 RepID=UPI0024AD14DC|nr:phage tail spike protein [Peptoniphilus sp. Marseille-Q7072]